MIWDHVVWEKFQDQEIVTEKVLESNTLGISEAHQGQWSSGRVKFPLDKSIKICIKCFIWWFSLFHFCITIMNVVN